MALTGFAGNNEVGTRSDCYVYLEITNSGGRLIELKSKVKALYGKSIVELANQLLDVWDVPNVHLQINDFGALPFVIAARLEVALKMATERSRSFLFEILPENRYISFPEKDRRSRLYLPGNSPHLMINAGIHKPDGIILDLEDSVAPEKKHEAQILVRNVLCQIDFYGAERMVRINQIPEGLLDLHYIVPYNPHVILIPKCESKEQVIAVDQEIERILGSSNTEIFFMPIIESALGVIKAYEIASSSKNVIALALGLEDYTADLGTSRTKKGKESFYAKSEVANAAHAAGVQAIDSVFSDVNDQEGLLKAAKEAKSLGYSGMGCIHPRQIKVIHEAFAPAKNEIEKAKKIVLAFDEANARGQGVVALGSKMIDPPVVKRALHTVELALKLGILNKDWKAHEQAH